MLVLGQSENQRIVVTVPPRESSIEIEITVCDLRPAKVRLGIEAPKRVAILRGELLDERRAR